VAVLDVTALHEELTAASLPVVGVSSDGRVDYSRDLTPEEQATAAAVIAAHDSGKRERDERSSRNAARDAAISLRLYLDSDSPTAAQREAAFRLLIRVVLWILRNELKV
jgi:hypothetical protein